MYIYMYISIPLSLYLPPSPSPTVPTSLFSMSVVPLLSCKWVHQHVLYRFAIYWVNVRYLFFSFQTTSLCIIDISLKLTQMCSFLCLGKFSGKKKRIFSISRSPLSFFKFSEEKNFLYSLYLPFLLLVS